MNIFYNGTDITEQVQVCGAQVHDHAGGRLDRIELCFRDPEQDWMRWGVRKEDEVRIVHQGFDTGTMFVDEYRAKAGVFSLGALSAPPAIRRCGTRAWENVRMEDILREFAVRAGMKMQTYGLPDNPSYTRIEQRLEPDIAWLNALCECESCALKVVDGALVVYYEPWLEQRAAIGEIALLDGTGHELETVTTGTYAGCCVRAAYRGSFMAPGGGSGPWLEVEAARHGIQIGSQREAERFAKGLLRVQNKYERILRLKDQPLDMSVAGGSVLEVRVSGAEWSGRWIVDCACHDLHRERTHLRLRKPLEGY